MHELSLAGGILKIVEDCATRENFSKVSLLCLDVGVLSGIEIRSLRFALESIVRDTPLHSAEIQINEVAGQAWCMPCAATVAFSRRGDPCPQCGSYQLQATAGTELTVREMIVNDH